MLKVFSFIFSMLLPWMASAQTMQNIGDPPAAKVAQPVPIKAQEWRAILGNTLCTDGTTAPLNTCSDGHDGYGWMYNSFSGKMELRPPLISGGPGAILSANAIAQNQWNPLYDAIGSKGFRGGLTAYLPRGNYVGNVNVTVDTGTSSNPIFTLVTLIGTCLQPLGSAQAGLLIPPQLTTTAATPSTSNVLTFANTTCIAAGMVAIILGPNATQFPPSTVLSTTSTTVLLNNPSLVGGLPSGTTIVFGYPIGWGVDQWPGGAHGIKHLRSDFNTRLNLRCLAADDKTGLHQQCEFLSFLFTNGAGGAQLATAAQSIGLSLTTLDINRLDGGYGAD